MYDGGMCDKIIETNLEYVTVHFRTEKINNVIKIIADGKFYKVIFEKSDALEAED